MGIHHGPVVENGAEDGRFGRGEFFGERVVAEEKMAVSRTLEGKEFQSVHLFEMLEGEF